ncbi:hypothetical protein J4449_04345 [Candidatus Woesearchaeota archaeon]|nr:hypothetical protein [Candidatus Woesearchaeota archaeon]
MNKEEIEEEQRKLVLARFKTLNPESKILLGGSKEITVKEIIKDIENGSDFGKKVVQVQMKMIQVLSTGV